MNSDSLYSLARAAAFRQTTQKQETPMYEDFTTWAQLADHVSAEYPLFYQGPMDYRPAQVTAVVRKDGKLRVSPVYTDADPFTADAGHLPRFKRHANRQT